MAIVTNYDIQINIVSFSTTHALGVEDAKRIYDAGAFKYTPPPYVESDKVGSINIMEEEKATVKSRVENVSNEIALMLEDLTKILGVFYKRSKDIILTYNPENIANEALANAEEAIFGTRSGKINYAMYEQVLLFEGKVDKWLSQTAMVNKGGMPASSVV